MGKEPNRLNDKPSERKAAKKRVAPEHVKLLESEIESSRRRLDAYVDELDRRRHRLLSVREHPAPAIGVAVGTAALVVGTIILIRRRNRRLARSRKKFVAIQEAFARMVAHPERVASDGKSPWSRVLVAAAPVAMKLLANAALQRRR